MCRTLAPLTTSIARRASNRRGRSVFVNVDKKTIRREAARLRKQVLDHVKSRRPEAENARQYLHPKFAFEMMGFVYEERPDLDLELRVLGEPSGVKRTVIAGQLDRLNKTVATSERQPPAERLFTAAHELGHLVLHKEEIQHRDRPIDLLAKQKLPLERQADVFAAAYLMPERWIAKDLESRFGSLPVVVNELLAWWLDQTDYERLLRPNKDADFERAKAVSICKCVGWGTFSSLAEAYGVTPTAMAYRLLELNLIKGTGYK